ncbi:phosphatase PAP2 family protein [Mycolicibacterium septicum]|uniref:phosphatase PAP2 family protein n=1 Tax=Mycolicibacterium septicum TaxID=98668 RepID=UPI0023E09EB6|nr:phosphatase PAP2 family protein [Mycolicibacterium septicum]
MAVVLLGGFVALGLISHASQSGSAADHRVLDWVVAQRNAWLTDVATLITDLGSPAAVALIAVGAATLISLRTRVARSAIVVVATVGLASVASSLVKAVVRSNRPPSAVQLLSENDHSFPSGHVTGTAALLGILAVIVGARSGHTFRLLVCAAVATFAVAATRLYLGVHWLTDVSGGFLLGSAAVLLGSVFVPRPAGDTPKIIEEAVKPRLAR